jgi:hypothetical protein
MVSLTAKSAMLQGSAKQFDGTLEKRIGWWCEVGRSASIFVVLLAAFGTSGAKHRDHRKVTGRSGNQMRMSGNGR